jgi:superfamily II DNA helicase RecQ
VQYSQLSLLRSFIPWSVPWLACSATLDPCTLHKVKVSCGFEATVEVQRTSVDRPDIFLSSKQLMFPVSRFKDLDFLIQPAQEAINEAVTAAYHEEARVSLGQNDRLRTSQIIALGVNDPAQFRTKINSRACLMSIKKTVVYFDSITTLETAAALLTASLLKMGYSKTASTNAIQAYHSELAAFDKESISQEFMKADGGIAQASSRHRIVMATDAMGMGINNPDIQTVVQWKQPASLCTLWQRAGRAARGASCTGQFIWLIDPACRTAKVHHEASQTGTRPKKAPAGTLPQDLYDVINSQICVRRSILEFFGEDVRSYAHPRGAAYCCNLCQGDTVFPLTYASKQTQRDGVSQKHQVVAAKTALDRWRRETADSLPLTYSRAVYKLVMPDDVLDKVSRSASFINTVDSLELLVGHRWAACKDHAAIVIEILKRACKESAEEKTSKYGTRKRQPLQDITNLSQSRVMKQQKVNQ